LKILSRYFETDGNGPKINLVQAWCHAIKKKKLKKKKSYILKSPLTAAATGIYCFLACVNTPY
jgi:hypothetical protein